MPTLRKIHIDEREWKYYFRGNTRGGKLIIFNPNGARHEITQDQYIDVMKRKAPTWDDRLWPAITPGDVKTYIEKIILIKESI